MFKIYAVGSNDVLTNEIKSALDQLLDNEIDVFPCKAALLKEFRDGDLYVCNHSMYKTVESFIEPSRIVLLNLMPTTAFYLQIREIPYGSDIIIFNNKRTYCETLESLCRSRGLNDYYYTALPYEQIPQQELEQQLSSAKYIIGVRDVIDAMLKRPPYSVLLRKDVRLIGAKRIVSVQTANLIVTQLNRMLLSDCQKQLSNLSQEIETMQQENTLYEHYREIISSINGNSLKLKRLKENDEKRDSIIVRAAIHQLNC